MKINRDNIPHLIQCVQNMSLGKIDTILSIYLAKWWGIKLGNNCKFYGVPIFRRSPGSTIMIGHDSRFISAKWANLIGINRQCIISTLRKTAELNIGQNCGFSSTVIAAMDSITIGQNVLCGANVTITDTDWHSIDLNKRKDGESGKCAPIIIENNVWLGLGVTVLKGVTIGEGAVVGAGSIVNQSLPKGWIACGQPARPIKLITT